MPRNLSRSIGEKKIFSKPTLVVAGSLNSWENMAGKSHRMANVECGMSNDGIASLFLFY
jgi:hypothetical protein